MQKNKKQNQTLGEQIGEGFKERKPYGNGSTNNNRSISDPYELSHFKRRPVKVIKKTKGKSMKKISLFLILAATITSACGGGESHDPFADCQDGYLLEVKETYPCIEGCSDICDFENMTIMGNESNLINTIYLNASANEISCFRDYSKTEYKPDLNGFSIAQGEKGNLNTWLNCDGQIQNDGIHVQCKHFLSDDPSDYEDCQEAIFQKAE